MNGSDLTQHMYMHAHEKYPVRMLACGDVFPK